jgi:hypothetical protein
LLYGGAAQAQQEVKNVGLLAGDNNTTIASVRFGGAWNTGPFLCTGVSQTAPNPPDTILVYPTTGTCNGRQVSLTFTNAPPNLLANHFLDYTITCDESITKLQHTMGICNTSGGTCTQVPINRGTFQFTAGSDTITVSTSEVVSTATTQPSAVPTLGEWARIGMGLGLAALAALLILRRSA